MKQIPLLAASKAATQHLSTQLTRWFVAAMLLAGLLPLATAQIVTHYHNDPFGNPVMATDAAGNVVWKENQRPYGERLNNTPAGSAEPIGFAGRPFDPAVGLSYMGARYYDPVLGRFISVDPVGFQENNLHSFNRYAYANNNPYKFVDRNGKYAEIAFEAFSIALGIDSARKNFSAGRYGAATVDALGVLGDAALTALPVAPGVIGLSIKTSREATETAARGVGEANSLANAARLRGQLVGQEIAGGHAFEKHVLNQGEFKGLGIRTREQFASHIENVVNNPTASRQLSGGRSAYWQESTGTVVIRSPRASDGGTAFQPTNGRAYFDGLR